MKAWFARIWAPKKGPRDGNLPTKLKQNTWMGSDIILNQPKISTPSDLHSPCSAETWEAGNAAQNAHQHQPLDMLCKPLWLKTSSKHTWYASATQIILLLCGHGIFATPIVERVWSFWSMLGVQKRHFSSGSIWIRQRWHIPTVQKINKTKVRFV